MPKRSNGLYLQENQEFQRTCTLYMTCQMMFWLSNLFPHLIGKTRFQKHIDDFIYTLLIYFFLYTILIVIPNKFIKIYLKKCS